MSCFGLALCEVQIKHYILKIYLETVISNGAILEEFSQSKNQNAQLSLFWCKQGAYLMYILVGVCFLFAFYINSLTLLLHFKYNFILILSGKKQENAESPNLIIIQGRNLSIINLYKVIIRSNNFFNRISFLTMKPFFTKFEKQPPMTSKGQLHIMKKYTPLLCQCSY